MLIIDLIFLAFAIGIAWIYIYMLIGEFKGAPWVPTSKNNEIEIWDRVKLGKGKLLIDVGSGDGRMLREAEKRYGVKGLGIEIQPILGWWSRLKGTKTIIGDFWKADLSNADYIYLYLNPWAADKLASKLEVEQKKEQTIISKVFEVKRWKNKIIDKWESKEGRVWVYRI